MRGRARSSANFVAPVTLATASTLRCARPITWSLLAPAIQTLIGRDRLFPSHPGRRQLHRFVDLDVAGATAQVARQRDLDLVARGLGVLDQQGLGGEQEGGGTIATLRRTEIGERFLQRME